MGAIHKEVLVCSLTDTKAQKGYLSNHPTRKKKTNVEGQAFQTSKRRKHGAKGQLKLHFSKKQLSICTSSSQIKCQLLYHLL